MGQPATPDLFKLDGTPYWGFFELDAGLPPGAMSSDLGLGLGNGGSVSTPDVGELR